VCTVKPSYINTMLYHRLHPTQNKNTYLHDMFRFLFKSFSGASHNKNFNNSVNAAYCVIARAACRLDPRTIPVLLLVLRMCRRFKHLQLGPIICVNDMLVFSGENLMKYL
jgi:hypothetical protein